MHKGAGGTPGKGFLRLVPVAAKMERQAVGKSDSSIREMFGRIAPGYDLMNAVMTFGMDRAWKMKVASLALSPGGMILDVGAGTGDIAMGVKRLSPGSTVIALDFTAEMMNKGRGRSMGADIVWCGGDALHLPFRNRSFDAVTSGYLIRNVPDPLEAFREQRRVLKPGGRVVCLDTSPPKQGPMAPFIRWYLRGCIPLMGSLIDGRAYRYLASSTQAFMEPERLASVMAKAGFERIWFRPLMFGTQTIHVGVKPL
jgi:demethylmenaquinone methyltransferase/2-methoxy-6-polyprenyl-1,4-benzoquinol methylase